MTSIQRVEKDLRSYLLKHHLPDLFESLLAALLVNKPANGVLFVLEKILGLQRNPDFLLSLQWDSFIDSEKRPSRKIDNLDFIWRTDDKCFEPSPEMHQKAHQHYNHTIVLMCFRALSCYWKRKVMKRNVLLLKLWKAKYHHESRIQRCHIHAWLQWLKIEKERQRKFVASLRKVFDQCLVRLVLKVWRYVAADAKNTREYFEKIEKGEIFDPADQPESEKMDHISVLPKHLAILIFQHVDLPDLVHCAKVCRAWKLLTQESVLWSRVDLTKVRQGEVSNKAFINLIQKCRAFICHLNVRGCDYLTPRALKVIGDCRNLQDINVSRCSGLTDDVVKEIAGGCSSLLYVNMSRSEISDASLRHLSRNCSNIQYLSLAHCQNISNKGLAYLASGKGSQKLIFLDLTGCEQITREGFSCISKGCVRMATLLLNEMPSLTDDCIEAFMGECRTLQSISILHSPLLTDISLKHLTRSRRLHTVKLEGNMRMTDAALKTLAQFAHELRHLFIVDFQRLTDMSLKALSHCKNLTVINLADCIRISDSGVRYIVEGYSGSKIRELNLTNCIRVSDVSMLRISQKCQSLVYANFSYCEHITDAGVELLATLKSLTALDVSGCNITDVGAVALGNNASFRNLVFSECFKITDAGVQKLVHQCRDLDTLDLSHVHSTSDQSIKSMAFYCRRLRILNLCGCSLVTDQGLQYLTSVCKYIEHLDISGCKCVSDSSLRFLRRGCRNLKSLNMLYCRGISKYSVAKLRMRTTALIRHSQEDVPEAYRRSPHSLNSVSIASTFGS